MVREWAAFAKEAIKAGQHDQEWAKRFQGTRFLVCKDKETCRAGRQQVGRLPPFASRVAGLYFEDGTCCICWSTRGKH